jgi:hypothetical protein
VVVAVVRVVAVAAAAAVGVVVVVVWVAAVVVAVAVVVVEAMAETSTLGRIVLSRTHARTNFQLQASLFQDKPRNSLHFIYYSVQ